MSLTKIKSYAIETTGTFAFPAVSTSSLTSNGTQLSLGATGFNSIALSTDNEVRLQIAAGGNIGIGTANPTSKLDVRGSNASIVIQDSDILNGPVAAMGVSGTSHVYFSSNSDKPIVFETGFIERARINEVGLTVAGSISVAAGTSSAPAITRTGDTNTGIFFPLNDLIALSTGGAERARLDAAGNLGLGTSFPNTKLHLHSPASGAAQIIQITNGSTGSSSGDGLLIGVDDSNEACIWMQENAVLKLATNNTERVRINSAGQVGIGVTPAPWSSSYRVLQLGTGTSIWSRSTTTPAESYYTNNARNNGIGYVRLFTGSVAEYEQNGGAHIWKSAGSGNAGTSAFLTEYMRITGSGDVGVGTSAPGYKLDVAGAIRGDSWIGRSNTSAPTADCAVFRPADNSIAFSTANTERVRINSAGNVGIGTASPTVRLDVNAAADAVIANFMEITSGSTRRIRILNSGTVNFIESTCGSGATNLAFAVDGTERMRIDTYGNVGVGVTPSPWVSTRRALDVGTTGALFVGGGTTHLYNNAYSNGTNFIYKTTGTATGYELSSTGEHRWVTAVSGTAGNITSFGRAMTLTAGGSLGINTTAPTRRLTVADTTAYMDFSSSSHRRYTLGSDGNGFVIYDDTSGLYRMVVSPAGNLGIGLTSPSYALHAAGTVASGNNNGFVNDVYFTNVRNPIWRFGNADGFGISYFQGAAGRLGGPSVDSVGVHFGTATAAASQFTISQNGLATISGNLEVGGTITESSTRKIKHNIRPISGALATINALQGVLYDLKDGSAHDEPGMIAEDVHAVVHNLVVLDRSGEPMGIKYTKTVAYLVEAVKELTARLAALEG